MVAVHNSDGSINTTLRIRFLPDMSLLFAYMVTGGSGQNQSKD